jgi:hypothetical protein
MTVRLHADILQVQRVERLRPLENDIADPIHRVGKLYSPLFNASFHAMMSHRVGLPTTHVVSASDKQNRGSLSILQVELRISLIVSPQR